MISKNIINCILYLVLFTNTSVYSSNIETHVDLRGIMKDAEFSHNSSKIIASNEFGHHRCTNEFGSCSDTKTMKYRTCICYYDDNKCCLSPYYSNANKRITKYDKTHLLTIVQEDISLLNFKLNNKLSLNKCENDILHILETNKDLSLAVAKEKSVYSKYNLGISNDIFNRFDNDIREIKSRNNIRDVTEQLKIDIYNQQQDMNKFTTKYDEEFKLMHNYFLNKFYQQNCITGIFKRLRIPKVYKTLFNKFKINTEELHNNIEDHEKLLDN